jgi:hypothetical protein
MYMVTAFTTAKQAICSALQYHLGGCKCTANKSAGTVKYLNSRRPAGMSVAVAQAQNPAEYIHPECRDNLLPTSYTHAAYSGAKPTQNIAEGPRIFFQI